jgi:hypothetical protein
MDTIIIKHCLKDSAEILPFAAKPGAMDYRQFKHRLGILHPSGRAEGDRILAAPPLVAIRQI